MDPSAPRRAILLKHDSIYYCEEKTNYEGTYNYYAKKFDSEKLSFLKKRAEALFSQEFSGKDVDDATVCSLTLYDSDSLIFRKEFVDFYLNKEQEQLINELYKLMEGRFEPVKKAFIHDTLLYDRLPEPPLPTTEVY